MNVHNKNKKYNGKKYLSFMLFYSVEVLSNIECYWILGETFYKLLILDIYAYVSTSHYRCIVTKTCKVIYNS